MNPRRLLLTLSAAALVASGLQAAPGAAGTAPAAKAPAKPAAPAAVKPAAPAWIARSNEYSQMPLKVIARFNPEGAARAGVEGLDAEVIDLKPKLTERFRAAIEEVKKTLESEMKAEKDPAVRQDLQILIDSADDAAKGIELAQKYTLPYISATQIAYQGIRGLLDDQIDPSRYPAALVRLKKYAGLEPGTTPLTQLAMDRTRERLSVPGLQGPIKAEMERDFGDDETYVKEIGELFAKYKVAGYEEPYARLKQQLTDYDAFLHKEVLPRSREDFRQPQELYAFSLKQYGNDMPVEEMVSRAKVAYMEIRNEMRALAPLVAKQENIAGTDYIDVLQTLKKKQLVGEAILPHYKDRIKQLEEIVRKEKTVTLPEREMRIRIASEAEAAAIPAPNMRPPRLLGNTGEMGEFILPLNIPSKDGKLSFDDFTYEAASWTLTVHEGRPGHELQFASMIEKGVSIPRMLFAFNSVNVEGWALYMEAEMKPYMPLAGQLVSLQNRLLRAARAFLDPELQLGRIQPEDAMRILTKEVGESEAMATQEVQRYTFRSPGQAPSYFVGYSRLMEVREDVERALGGRLDVQKYHDFILSQGLVPPKLLRQALLEDFVPAQKKAIAAAAAAAGASAASSK
ncbi:MAG TPA: DUF885 domain-containing protein [Candidatus Polarisedimenticolia bacterium]|nr:DUF885 domain-containing protein [Candidatus Polarisedimenticolia bacterium]